MLSEGDRAPDFSGETAEGKRIGLVDFRGKQPLVLYFYPKDNTFGCTREAVPFAITPPRSLPLAAPSSASAWTAPTRTSASRPSTGSAFRSSPTSTARSARHMAQRVLAAGCLPSGSPS